MLVVIRARGYLLRKVRITTRIPVSIGPAGLFGFVPDQRLRPGPRDSNGAIDT
jgi:hypothetical protein